MGERLRTTQNVTSTRVRRPSEIKPMMRASRLNWSLGQEKPGREGGPAAIKVGAAPAGEGRKAWGACGEVGDWRGAPHED